MGALVQIKPSRFASFRAIVSSSRPRRLPARSVLAREPRAFPEAPTRPTLPPTIRDEMLELYAFIFCQGGFRQLEMSFEQFLLVAAAIKPADPAGDPRGSVDVLSLFHSSPQVRRFRRRIHSGAYLMSPSVKHF
jgi:hypothetical protein